jgi:hypothetical protein
MGVVVTYLNKNEPNLWFEWRGIDPARALVAVDIGSCGINQNKLITKYSFYAASLGFCAFF